MPARRIGVVTTTRADYGLLEPVMRALQGDPRVELQVIVTGTHLSMVHGRTIDAIDFDVAAEIDIGVDAGTGLSAARSAGRALTKIAEAVERLDCDIVIVLGDRFEVLAAAQAVVLTGRVLAHVHGGEVTTGSFDDSMRHAITKLAHVHFVAAEPYRRRVLQLGESEDLVFNVGAPGLDQLATIEWMDRPALEQSLGVELVPPVILVTHHPVTTADDPARELAALTEALGRRDDATIVLTMPNADPGGDDVADRVQSFADTRPRVHLFASLGTQRYLSLLVLADVVVGNSSSGIIEAPAVGTPTVNVGPRQDGRLRASSIRDVPADSNRILQAIEEALATPRSEPVADALPYGAGGAGQRIAEVLAELDLTGLRAKPFVDRPVVRESV